jgi:hypothetical protein
MLNTHIYLKEVTNFFIKKGNKARIEKFVYNFLIYKAKMKRINLHTIIRKCNLKTTPYLQIKTRKRGKRIKYRINYLETADGYKKSVYILGKSIGTTLKTSPRHFSTVFERELDSWSLGKHPLRKKYLAVHILARKNAPFRWFLPSRKKNYNKNSNKKLTPLIKKCLKVHRLTKKKASFHYTLPIIKKNYNKNLKLKKWNQKI